MLPEAKDHGPTAAGVYVDIRDPCCLQRPQGCPVSGLPSVVIQLSEGQATIEALLILSGLHCHTVLW